MLAVLETEWRTYLERKQEFLRDAAGKYVLIHGESALGFFDSESEGLRAAYRIVGLKEPFLLHRVEEEEPTAYLGIHSFGA